MPRYLQKPAPYEIETPGIKESVTVDIDDFLLLVFRSADPFQTAPTMRKGKIAMRASEEAGPGGVAELQDDLWELLKGVTEGKDCPVLQIPITMPDGQSGVRRVAQWDLEPVLNSIANAGVTPPTE